MWRPSQRVGLAWIHRNVFAPCAVLAGRKPLAVAGRRIQKVHDLSGRNGPLTRARAAWTVTYNAFDGAASVR
jgi:hypothetical protein